MNPDKLQSILRQAIREPQFPALVFSVRQGEASWTGSAGNCQPDQPFFIASTTKLFVTALILQQISRNKLSLETPIASLLPETLWNKIHVFKGKDCIAEISIRHLLAHTSGLPDYFGDAPKDGVAWQSRLLAGEDFLWTTEAAVEQSRRIAAHFPPGTAKRAHYSDTNFQLLGRITEILSGKSLSEQLEQEIIRPLGLHSTYLYTDPADRRPLCLRYRDAELSAWKAMASFGADGGIVSTAAELRRFTDAFFKGELFPATLLPELKVWYRIFFPMRSGIGIHLFRLPWIFNPFGTVPPLIGHSGLSGTVAFYDPVSDSSIAGTANQIHQPGSSFRLMIKLLMALRKP